MLTYRACARSSDIDDSPSLCREYRGNFLPVTGSVFLVNGNRSAIDMVAHYWNQETGVVSDMAFLDVNREVLNLIQASSFWSNKKPLFMPE
jgi:hypothetical protein